MQVTCTSFALGMDSITRQITVVGSVHITRLVIHQQTFQIVVTTAIAATVTVTTSTAIVTVVVIAVGASAITF